MTTRPDDDDDDVMAAEYVLGVTDLAARQAAEARARRDPAFAARIAAWEARFAPLNDAIAEAPAPDLMPRIEARLFPIQPARRAPWAWLRGLGPGLVVLGLVAWFMLAPARPELTATLVPQNGGPTWLALLSGQDLVISRMAGRCPGEGRDFELWIIRGDAAPVSLGVMPATGMHLTVTDVTPGTVLAVSLEPKGGSPTGQPTGPILALGPLQKT